MTATLFIRASLMGRGWSVYEKCDRFVTSFSTLAEAEAYVIERGAPHPEQERLFT